jgi:arylsulfatase A-like enzyme
MRQLLLSVLPALAFVPLTLAQAQMAPPAPAPAAPKYNVLFIISDDLRAELGTYGGHAITPNLDRLASQSVKFDNAYCQFPLCNPSRSSMLTGRYPGATGVLGNRTWFGEKHPDFVSMPRWFKDHGYVSLRSGKVFHEGIDDTDAWTVGGERRTLGGVAEEGETPTPPPAAGGAPVAGPVYRPTEAERHDVHSPYATGLAKAQHSDRWVVMPNDGHDDGDYRKTTRAIELLDQYHEQPFFLAFGLSKPHSPPGAPQRFYDLYDVNKIELPPDFQPRPTVPEGFPRGSIRPRNADLFIGRDASVQEAKEVTRAYYASCSYVDDNVGRMLAEVDKLGLRKNTIIVFWGDHGYELGEKGKWSKAGSLWEEGDRTPFFMYVPGMEGNGKVCTRVVQNLDIYPTLVELCGLPNPPQGLEGRSFTALLHDPAAAWNHPAFTVWSEDGLTFTGIGVRTEQWRYAEFTSGGAMLLDVAADPHQMKNLADDPKYAATRQELSAQVKDYLAHPAPGN